MALKHPVFNQEHNPGQRTTTHRSVEKARLMAAQKGPHPEKGQFQKQPNQAVADIVNKQLTSKEGLATEQEVKKAHSKHDYKAPSGATVTVEKNPDEMGQPLLSPDDKTKTVTDPSGSKQTLSEPAADVYLEDRFGVSHGDYF